MNRDFKGIWIPKEIWLHPELKSQEKALWAEIHSLYSEEHGGCYASEEYLMEFIGVKVSRLREIFAKLKELGLLLDVSFDGRRKIRMALIPEVETSGKVEVCPPQQVETSGKVEVCDPEKWRSLPIYERKEEKKENKRNIKEKKIQEEKVSVREHVTLTQEEHEKIKLEYGDWTERALDVLEAHKASKGATYKSDYAVFKKGGWLHDKFLAEKDKTSTSQAKNEEKEEWKTINSNKDFFMECKQDNPDDSDIQNMYCSGNWLCWPEKSKELSLKMNPEAFKSAFLGMLGVGHED